MSNSMQFDLVSPERKLASMQANMVQIPGADGDFTAMPNHAATVASLRPGIMRVVADNGDISEYVVSGGFAEISAEGTSVLAESAMLKASANADFLATVRAQAEDTLAQAGEDAVLKAAAELSLNDINDLIGRLG